MAVTGWVKHFNYQKGFGFIYPDTGGEAVFLGIKVVDQAGITNLAQGQRLIFDIDPNPTGKGPRAINVKRPAAVAGGSGLTSERMSPEEWAAYVKKRVKPNDAGGA
jgi:CspA family cold shock protein